MLIMMIIHYNDLLTLDVLTGEMVTTIIELAIDADAVAVVDNVDGSYFIMEQ